MVFIDVGLVSLIVGKLLGGRFTALADMPIRAKGLAFTAIGLQLVAFPSQVLPWSMPTPVAKVLWLGSYVLLITMLLLNARVVGVAIVAAGLACNLVAIVANGGLMPVLGSALRAAGRSYHVQNNSIALAQPHLALLVDRWAAPAWLPLANVFSVGDIVIGVGTLVAIVVAMRAPVGARAEAATAAIGPAQPTALP